ncbi:unnamed protein product, partial [marine sediment metagenome]
NQLIQDAAGKNFEVEIIEATKAALDVMRQ